MLILLIFSVCMSGLNALLYDCYTGKLATRTQVRIYREKNNTQYCLIDVKPCDENEWRRGDGSCNNLKYPSIGTARSRTRRVLPHDFSPNYEARKTNNGGDLPLARYLRNQILKDGKASELDITHLVSFYLLFAVHDVNTFHEILNYIFDTTTCCQPEGKSEYMCTPNKIPVDDPVHRYSGVNCYNLTRPQTFQYFGCADFGTTEFSRIVFTTPTFDLSSVYGNERYQVEDQRAFEKGLLKIEIENGKLFPPKHDSNDPDINKCGLNQLPKETRCHKYVPSGAIGPNILAILFYRFHNYIATELAKLNKCWSDERLYHTARDINIAIHMQIYFRELLPIVLGQENMIKDGVISCSDGFRDLYDENVLPQISDEFPYVSRWFHTIQETDMKLYDTDGAYLKTIPMVNISTRTGYLPIDNNMAEIIQCSFRQIGGKFDDTIDADMGQRILGNLQYASDGASNDLAKGRFFGMQPYVKYREFCAKRLYDTFDSFKDVMTKEKIFRLTDVYEHIEDVELLAALWAERRMPGSRVPPTVYCLMTEHLKRALASDRHWYERPNRPHAFTMEQLLAIRKATIAGVLCVVGDGVTVIQKHAFYTISNKNPLVDCSEVGIINLSAWKEKKCTNE